MEYNIFELDNICSPAMGKPTMAGSKSKKSYAAV